MFLYIMSIVAASQQRKARNLEYALFFEYFSLAYNIISSTWYKRFASATLVRGRYDLLVPR